MNRAWNPAIHVRLACDFPGGLRGGPSFSPYHDVPILIGPRIRESLPEFGRLGEQFPSFLCESVCFKLQRLGVSSGETVSNATDRAFQLQVTVKVALQQTHTQRAQFGDDLAPYHSQCLRSVAGDQHALAFSKQVTDKISYGVRFSRARRSLDQHSARVLGPSRDPDLLRIGGLGKKDISIRLIPVG